MMIMMLMMVVIYSDVMLWPQMDWAWFGNISTLDLVEPNQIRDSIYVCIKSLFGKFLTLKLSHTCTYCLTFLAVTGDQCRVRVQGVCRLQPVILCCILSCISCTDATH